MAIKATVVGALTTRAAAGVAAAALALGGGAVAASAATGHAHPASWGQKVAEAVENCKQEVRSDASGAPRNVGQCVSAFARKNGQTQRANHTPEPQESQSATANHGQAGETDHHGQPSPLPAGAQAGQSHGQTGQSHGQSDQTHGQSGSGHGQAKPSPSPHS